MTFRSTRITIALLGLSAPFAAAVDFDAEIRPFLDRHCVSCHGPDKQKSGFRVDTLDSDFLNGGDVDLWQEVLDLVNVSEMPPDDAKSMPTDAERSAFSDALTALMRQALEARRSTGGQNVLRRLTAYEYNNTLRDLLGLDLRYATDLPPEGVAHEGFQNNVTVLGTSALHLEYFESIARSALSRIILVPEEQPELYFVRVEPELAEQKTSRKGGAKQRALDKVSVTYEIKPGEDYTGPGKAIFVTEYGEKHETGIRLAGNRPDDPVNRPFEDDQKKGGAGGDGRSGYQPEFRVEMSEVPYDEPVLVRIHASAVPGAGETWPRLSFELGSFRGAGTSDQKEAANMEITSTEPQTYEFVVQGANFPFQSNNPRRPSYFRVFNDFRRGTSDIAYEDLPKLDIDWVEITCSYYESWPTPQHKAILPQSELRESDEVAYAREVLAGFMPRAYRRPVDDAEIDRKVALFRRFRERDGTFEKTIISTLTTVLCSPNFLLISEPAESEVDGDGNPERRPLNNYELASRLSYFLWSSMPDEVLFELAASGQLTEPDVLTAQVRRMIADPKIEGFSRNFATQWLDLDGIYRLAINPEYFRFPEKFKPLFAEESVQFVHHVLTEDLPISNFIDSDFAVLHPILAKHYRIPGISGGSFQAIDVAPEDHRGGLMTHASMLFGSSTGAETHPIRRGVWVLERMLDDPPPPPPPNVPDLPEPETTAEGTLSLKERLIAHANVESCRDCHSKIDPWGVAFENYNALGQWREGNLDPLAEKPHQQVEIDAATRLRNGTEIQNLADLQNYILTERRDQFRRAVVSKVMAYSLGRYVEFSDRAAIDEICEAVEIENDSFQAVLEQVVLSQPFLTK